MTHPDRYQAIFQSASELLWMIAPHGTILTANQAVYTAWNVTAPEVEGQPLWDRRRWTPEAGREIHTVIKAVVAGKTPEPLLLYTPFPDTPISHLELCFHPVMADDGTLEYLLVEGEDVSTRQTTLKILRVSQERLLESQRMARIGSGTWNLVTGESYASPMVYEILGLAEGNFTFESFTNLLHPDDRARVLDTIQTYIQTPGRYEIVYRVIRPDGQERVMRGRGEAERNAAGQPLYMHGVIQDITERTHIETTVARMVERLETFNLLAQNMATHLDTGRIYQDVTAALGPLIGAAGMFVLIPEGEMLVVKAGTLPTKEPILERQVPFVGTPAGEVWRTGESLLLQYEEWKAAAYSTLYDDVEYQPRVIALAPLSWQNQRLGVLHASHHDPDAFSPDAMRLLETAATWLAIALMNARLWESQRQARALADARRHRMHQMTRRIVLAQEQERQRLARELHDESGQSLTALKISLELLNQIVEEPNLHEGIAEAAALTGDTMEHIRRLSHQLRPPALDTFGLDVTLDGLCAEVAHYTGINVQYHGGIVPAQLSEVPTIVLYRFAQEAVNHATSYSNVTQIDVSLRSNANAFIVEVRDNGKRTRSDSPPVSDVVAERLELVEGSFTVEKGRRKGGCVAAHIPLHWNENSP